MVGTDRQRIVQRVDRPAGKSQTAQQANQALNAECFDRRQDLIDPHLRGSRSLKNGGLEIGFGEHGIGDRLKAPGNRSHQRIAYQRLSR